MKIEVIKFLILKALFTDNNIFYLKSCTYFCFELKVVKYFAFKKTKKKKRYAGKKFRKFITVRIGENFRTSNIIYLYTPICTAKC